jgi:hypothetical protein
VNFAADESAEHRAAPFQHRCCEFHDETERCL